MHGHPFNLVFLDPGIECGLGEAHDTQRWIIYARPPGLFADGQPDLEGHLGGEFMKAQRGEQTDHPVRRTFTDLGKRSVFRRTGFGKDIETAADPLQLAGSTKAAQASPRDVVRIEIPRPQNPRFPDQFQDLVCLCGLGNHEIGMLQ